jgi:hypothetical protein
MRKNGWDKCENESRVLPNLTSGHNISFLRKFNCPSESLPAEDSTSEIVRLCRIVLLEA